MSPKEFLAELKYLKQSLRGNRAHLVRFSGGALLRRDPALRRDYAKVYLPIMCSQVLWGISVPMQTAILGHLSDDAIAANSIATTFYQLGWNGSITKQLPVFLLAILIVMVGHYIWLALLYGLGGPLRRQKPSGGFEALWSRLSHRRGHHVLRRHPGRGPGLRPEEQEPPLRHGGVRHSPVRQHPPLRLRPSRRPSSS